MFKLTVISLAGKDHIWKLTYYKPGLKASCKRGYRHAVEPWAKKNRHIIRLRCMWANVARTKLDLYYSHWADTAVVHTHTHKKSYQNDDCMSLGNLIICMDTMHAHRHLLYRIPYVVMHSTHADGDQNIYNNHAAAGVQKPYPCMHALLRMTPESMCTARN